MIQRVRASGALSLCFMFLCLMSTCSQQKPQTQSSVMKEAESGGYTYQFVEGDPMNVRIYTLKNGLKVYLSNYDASPNVYTNIAVKVGGKNDPSNNTGLSHYLEHIMFKGTSSFGTIDWEKEAALLNEVEALFETYKTLTDPEARRAHYRRIDSLSVEASKYAIPNEYDKMITDLGGTDTNAYTSHDRTVYINNIPSNQVEKWLEIEAERFKEIVPRLFHTELETVYEEKNRTLDSDAHKAYERLDELVFKEHPYGKQSVIGTAEHLKNPSITAIKKHFDTYYRPNNTAIVMSGELDYDQVIAWVDEYFGGWEASPSLPVWERVREESRSGVESAVVRGPSPAFLLMSFPIATKTRRTQHLSTIADMILSNEKVGLIDLNINQKQRVLNAYSTVYDRNDYDLHLFHGTPREGQSLEEVRDIVLAEVEKLKNGDFEEWLLEAIVSDLEMMGIRSQQSNRARCGKMTAYFSEGILWSEHVDYIPSLREYTKEDVVAFAQSTYGDNYAVVHKEVGEDRDTREVEKPAIGRMVLNKENKSPFYERIMAKEVEALSPRFLNYEEDIQNYTLESGLRVYAVPNTENDLFSLYAYYDLGGESNPVLRTAIRYVQYLSPEGMTPEAFQEELYKVGCSFDVSVGRDNSYMHLKGLSKNIERGLQLMEELIANPWVNEEAFVKMIESIKKERKDAKKQKASILNGGLLNYALYGKRSPFTNVLSNEQLDKLSAEELIEVIKDFSNVEHRILYYGPENKVKMTQLLNQHHRVSDQLRSPNTDRGFQIQPVREPMVYWAHYDMVQTEMIFVSRQERYDASLVPSITLFNEYFSGGMASIMFQELREAQALAYSTHARYSIAREKDKHNVFFSYIGTQADKQAEAVEAVKALLTNTPRVAGGFALAKSAILKNIESERILRTAILFDYERAKRLGIDFDIRRRIYEEVQTMTLDDLMLSFHEKNIRDNRYHLLVVGDREAINLEDLKKHGIVQELSLEEIFGY